MKTTEFFSVWKQVFSKWRYGILALVIALTFYSINVVIAAYDSLISFYVQYGFLGALKLFFTFFLGFIYHVKIQGFVSLLILSFLFGIFFSLISYKTIMLKSYSNEKTGVLGSLGIFLGILAPGCAACGIGILSALGLGTVVLTFLPLEGLEISILAIIILCFATFKITKDINKGIICEIPVLKNKTFLK